MRLAFKPVLIGLIVSILWLALGVSAPFIYPVTGFALALAGVYLTVYYTLITWLLPGLEYPEATTLLRDLKEDVDGITTKAIGLTALWLMIIIAIIYNITGLLIFATIASIGMLPRFLITLRDLCVPRIGVIKDLAQKEAEEDE